MESINLNSQVPAYTSYERAKFALNIYLNNSLDYNVNVYLNVNRELIHKMG